MNSPAAWTSFPPSATLTGKPLSPPKTIGGLDISKTLTKGAKSPRHESPRHEFLHYASAGQLEGIRQGDWKLLVKNPGKKKTEVLLFNLNEDVAESTNLAAKYPEKVELLKKRMTELDAEITDNSRPPGGKLNR